MIVRARLDNFGNCPLGPEGALMLVGQADALILQEVATPTSPTSLRSLRELRLGKPYAYSSIAHIVTRR
jgi:hypothetical protein